MVIIFSVIRCHIYLVLMDIYIIMIVLQSLLEMQPEVWIGFMKNGTDGHSL